MNNIFSSPVGHDEPIVVYTPTFLKNMSDLVIRTDRRYYGRGGAYYDFLES